jgi:hypothetical protein
LVGVFKPIDFKGFFFVDGLNTKSVQQSPYRYLNSDCTVNTSLDELLFLPCLLGNSWAWANVMRLYPVWRGRLINRKLQLIGHLT